MGKCAYVYNGREFTDQDALFDALIEDNVAPASLQNKDRLTISGDEKDLDFKEFVIREDAKREFGTDEFISITERDGKKYVDIDTKAIDEINSGEKLIRNTETGQMESVNMEQAYNQARLTNEIPSNLENIEEHLEEHMWDKAIPVLEQRILKDKKPGKTDLESRLVSFANRLGITVDTLDNYRATYGLRTGENVTVEAIADMLRKIIAISNNASTGQLAEEVSHFAIEYFDDQAQIDELLANVDKTTTYQKEAGKYRTIYAKDQSGKPLSEQALERKVRKEVLGQILAERIEDNFTLTGIPVIDNIIRGVQRLWNDLLAKFRVNDQNRQFFKEFGQVLDQIAEDVVDSNMSSFRPRIVQDHYYSASMTEDQILFRDTIQNHVDQLKNAYLRLTNASKENRQVRLSKLKQITDELSNLSYYSALNQYLSVLAEDVNSARNTIETAKDTNPDKFTDAIDNVDLHNLNNFMTGVTPVIEAIGRFIRDESRSGINNSVISQADLRKLESRVEGIQKNYQSIQRDLQDIADSVFLENTERILDEFDPPQSIREKIMRSLNANMFKDIGYLATNLYSAFNLGNPIIQLATAVYKKAETRIRRKVNHFGEQMRDMQRKYGFTQKQIDKLFDKFHMISPFHYTEWEADYEIEKDKIRTKYDKLVNEINETDEDLRLEKEAKLLWERDKELNDLMFEWETPQFRREFYRKMEGLHPNAMEIIQNRTLSRNKIYNRYRGRDGKVRYELIASSDLVKLQEAQRTFRSAMSLYHQDGSLKTGKEKLIAKQLRDYFENSDFSNVEFQKEEFEAERQRVMSKYGENSSEYRNWLGLYANVTYTEDDFAQFETREVDEAFQPDIAKVFEMKEALGIPEDQDVTMQELYDGLIEKRRQLTAPYKRLGKFNEIDGNQIESNESLKEELDRIRQHLSNFVVLEALGNPEVSTLGNQAYVNKIMELKSKGKTRELQDFFRRHASQVKYFEPRLGENIPEPTTYHYRTFMIEERPPQPQPNYLWIERDTDNRERNPEFNMAFRGKAKMPNKNKTQYVNDDYFSTFGINKDEVFAPGADSFGTATQNKDLWELRQFFLDNKEEDDKRIGQYNSYFLLPQIRADRREVGAKKGLRPFKASLKDSFVVEGDDDLGARVGDGNNSRARYRKVHNAPMIPRYYTKKLKKHEDLTRNISMMYGRYKEMAVNYEEKTAILPTMLNFRQRLSTSSIQGKPIDGSQSNLIKVMDHWFETVLYGQTHSSGGIIRIGETEISTTKFAKSLYRFISTVNLGFNIFVPVIGYYNATLTKRMEGIAGNDVTTGSLNWANKEFIKHMPSYANSVGSISPRNKIKKMFEFAGVNMERGEIYDGVFNSKAFRLNKDWAYKHYQMAGTATGAHAILAVYDNYRLYNGRFVSSKSFREQPDIKDLSDAQKDQRWAELKPKSYYNYLKENEFSMELDVERMRRDGFEGDRDALESRMNRVANEFHDKIEGLVSVEDRSMLQRHTSLMFLSMHRGWLQSAIQQRFKRRQINIFTGVEEEGNYITLGRVIGDNWREHGWEGMWHLLAHFTTLGYAYRKAVTGGLEEFEKANLRRIYGDGIAYMLGLSLFLLANVVADDDEDDWLKQYIGYIASRGFSEVLATIPATAPGQIYEILLSPLAGISMLEDLVNLPGFLMGLTQERDLIKTGAYRDMPQWSKELIRKTPIKNIFEPVRANSRRSNIFFRNNVFGGQNVLLEHIEKFTDDQGITNID